MMSRALGLGVLLLLVLPAHAQDDSTQKRDQVLAPLIAELRAQQTDLKQRARLLDDREAQVSSLEAAVDARLKELQELSHSMQERISRWEATSGDNVRRLSKIYAAMPAARAAALIKGLDVDLATQVVAKMKDKQSAAILALLPEKRALAMSRKVAHPLAMEPAVPAKGGH